MKFKSLMMTAVILVASSSVMLADLQVSSIPVTTVRSDGTQELVGSVRFTVIAPVSGNTGTISIDYGVAVSANSVITVTPTGTFTTAAPTVSGNVVTITVTAAGGAGDSITVSGVRVDATGGFTTLDVSVSSTALPIVAGQTVARVVNNSAPSKSVSSITTAVILTDETVITGSGNITIAEGFPSAWGTLAEEGAGADTSYQIRLTVAALPTGATLGLAIDGLTSGTLTPVIGTATLTSTVSTSVISFTATSRVTVETLVIKYTYVSAGPTVPLAPAAYNITATAFPAAGTEPSFLNNEMGAMPALTVISGTTTLLFDYAVYSAAAGVDTGFAIANTSADGLAFTSGNAVPVEGTITFHMYPNDGTAPFSYTTTAGSPGSGLDANGQVVAGSTYVVLLSEVLAAAGAGDFSGYIFAVCDFTHGHGIDFVGDFVSFTQTIQGLVILDPTLTPVAPASNSRAALVGVGGEVLGP